MRRTVACLNSVKSRCFVLLACLGLFVGTTSCNDDEFETVAPEGRKQYTKAELIEQALSRMPRTRGNNARVEMITIGKSVEISYVVTEEMEILLEDGMTFQINGTGTWPWPFADGKPSHGIRIFGPEEALRSLSVDGCGLISLEMDSNPNLTSLECGDNHLDELDFANCPNLQWLYVANNEFSSLDVSCLDKLESFDAGNNRLTNIVFNEHPYMYELFVENNQLTNLDLSGVTDLYMLVAQNNPLKNLNLKECIYLDYLNISSAPITTLDLSNNTNLWEIVLENTSIKVFNNRVFCDTSFSVFKELRKLNVANSKYESLDLSRNPNFYSLNISGSAVTRVNLTNTLIYALNATRSQLTTLIWEKDTLDDLFEVWIESTPFEKDEDSIVTFAKALPDRREMAPGHLFTYSRYVNRVAGLITPLNWQINQ